MRLLFSDFTPDLPSLGHSIYVNNVLPARGSYRPMPDLAVYSDALDARCQGAVGGLDPSGNVYNFAGDATKLYALTAGSTSWDDASKSGGYTTAADAAWRFANYDALMIATNYTDPIQAYTMGTSTDFDNLSSGAPNCRYLAISKNFTFAINTSDGTYGGRPQRVWWSAIGNPTSWPTPGSSSAIANQSDFQDLAGDGGWCQGGAGGLAAADLLILQERAAWRGTYVGGDIFWQFDQVEGARGTPAPGSIVQVGGLVYYLGEDGFYVTDGASSRPIGASKIDKTFFADLDQTYYFRISSAADPINKIVMWAYPNGDSPNGVNNKIIAYNWEADRWSMIDGITCELLIKTLSFGYTLEQLDTVSSSIDDLPFSLDSRAYTGGKLLLGGFDSSHKLNYFTSTPLEADIDTIEEQPVPNQRCTVMQVWPLVDGGTLSVTPITRNRQNDSAIAGTTVSQNATGYVPLRTNARYHRYGVNIAAGGTWQHAIGVEIPEDQVAATGAR